MEGDEIKAEFNQTPEEEIIEPSNPLLDDVLDFYQCDDLLPLAQRIIWLSSLKEVLGYIPNYIPIDYEELRYLVALHEEQNKKMAYDSYKMNEESKRLQAENMQSQSGINDSPIIS
jgi:hypothetical protein